MVPIIYFVFIFFGYISIREVSSAKSCPDAKYLLADIENYGYLACADPSKDPCLYFPDTEKLWFSSFHFTAPEDVTDIYFNVSISGDKIDASGSGKGEGDTMQIDGKIVNSFPKNSKADFFVEAELKGDLPVGEEGVARVEVYFNEDKKDTPDLCVTGNIKIDDV